MDMGENIISLRCIVSGRVQGVFFRASTREQALQLNICGYAKNLSNGDVEVIAHGKEDDVRKLRLWIQHGPQYADVKYIDCQIMSTQETEKIDLEIFKIL